MVLVVWHDAHSEASGWHEVSEVDAEPCVVQTVGWLLPEVKAGHVVVAQSLIAGSETIDSTLSIPVGMVQSIQLL
jgi:hypothetical protein